MARSRSSRGLSIGYRIGYRLRLIGLTIFGPAQLGEGNDPKARLERERAAKVAAARTTSPGGDD
ncbi:hypothetical protein GCM10009868_25250 [Terrabacter aerolatus]|uniref:Uncharacterized protein n=1 Tax=Terrabacter aerolatus TaxID=422442 RepID=A0A512D1T4_9MICO|nr:hypothetical protein [Terrabacter aerolatus]GEO30210.1 hypothetical protein TAE01_20200 [Terrabacter aerolatus]